MTQKSKDKLVKILFILGAVLATLQTFITSAGIPNVETAKTLIIAGILGIVSSIVATWYQYLSKHIPNQIALTGLFMLIVSTLGGVLDILNIVPINEQWSAGLTWGISLISFLFQFLSKMYYVPEETPTN